MQQQERMRLSDQKAREEAEEEKECKEEEWKDADGYWKRARRRIKNFRKAIYYARPRRAVPSWAVPNEIWRSVLNPVKSNKKKGRGWNRFWRHRGRGTML
jgi:hypothetical protein